MRPRLKKGDRVVELIDGAEGVVEDVVPVKRRDDPDEYHVSIRRDDGLVVSVNSPFVERV